MGLDGWQGSAGGFSFCLIFSEGGIAVEKSAFHSAEAVMRKLAADAGLAERLLLDSAGTDGEHAGDLPDSRMRQHARPARLCPHE